MVITAEPGTPIEIFLSYSHRDETLRRVLEDHLALLRRQELISTWHDRQIGAGTEWAGQIDEHIDTAGVILLLVSPAFLASDYCYDKELTRALQRHEAGAARVIPIVLRPVDWKHAPFGKLQVLPRDGRPITTWSNRDEAWRDVAIGIRKWSQVCDLSCSSPLGSRLGSCATLAAPRTTTLEAVDNDPPSVHWACRLQRRVWAYDNGAVQHPDPAVHRLC